MTNQELQLAEGIQQEIQELKGILNIFLSIDLFKKGHEPCHVRYHETSDMRLFLNRLDLELKIYGLDSIKGRIEKLENEFSKIGHKN